MAEETLAIITSFAQQSLWLQNQIDPGRSDYTVAAAVRLRGALDVPALEAALNAVAARHETLRTVFRLDDGVPVQVIGPVPDLRIPVEDVTPGQVDDLVRQETGTPFDLATGPLLRLRLLRLSPEEHVAVLAMHHIVTDGDSSAILLRELMLRYAAGRAGTSPELPELPVQYADYAVWQRETLSGPRLDRLTAYWAGRLAGATPVALPAAPGPGAAEGAPRAAEETPGAVHPVAVPAGLRDRLEAAARERGATLFMALLAGFGVLLARHCRQDDITVLSPVSGRSRPELEELIGYFVNPLPLRTDLSGDPAADEVLDRARETCLGAYDHQDLPYEQISHLAAGPATDRGALGRVMMVLQSPRPGTWHTAGLELEQLPVGMGAAKAGLVLDLRPGPDGLEGVLEYDAALLDASTVAALAEDLPAVLGWLADRSPLPVSAVPGLKGPAPAAAAAPARAATGAQSTARAPYVAPRTPLEEEIALIWAELLGQETVGVYDNFFDLGGQSLAAVRLAARLRDEFGVELAVRELFAGFTVEEVAWRVLQELTAAGPGAPEEAAPDTAGEPGSPIRT
ncbi:condensation domain-containing protein [Streptomyces sp. URMC 127]|uniref:condensation domain-containing protein n=1 Tax=Streptomyces sp. URMC 127 TaxID=3423402 RepID=UPI003F1A6214